ncbi:L-lactate permease [Ktedonobacter sp. SOSP1-85]|uniref:L-lactate permease n=1 Tax=Ktedonobacter sp. SOSP1-85 TaxID=2778367 RepID=UPI0019162A44|nr:L-lactate permease [Ktedonobacter sp. SOSP1-85]GHO80865.1 L-lactate permease [Ktedonobacter sp. SOSP1-85]
MTWTQSYTPVLGNLFLSALIAALPVIVLLGLLGFFHVRAHWAALAGLATALLAALLVFGMPAQKALAATLNGAAYGLFPIGWIIIGAIFVYDITVRTGNFEIVKQTVANLADDRRLQLLLIAFSFGAFVEGAAGFGTPVAVTAAMLIGLGFRPLPAAGLALIGNTAPVAFGALGAPINGLSTVTGIPVDVLSAMIGRQLPFFSLIVPFWLIFAMSGWRSMLEVWPACLVTGLSFALTQFVISNYFTYTLVDIIGALVSILCLVVFLRIWKPKTTWRFAEEREALAASANTPEETSATEGGVVAGGQPIPASASAVSLDESDVESARATTSASGAGAVSLAPDAGEISFQRAFIAWLPWIILAVILFIWGLAGVKAWFNALSDPKIPVPFLHNLVLRAPPVVATPTKEAALFDFNWLSATGTALLLTGVISGFVLGLKPLELLKTFWGTLMRLRFSLLTIAAMLAIGYTTRYAGLDATMGLAFASTGLLFPFFSPVLGWLGVALTGSDTSSNVLFGSLQTITAKKLGISPVLAAASNSSGGVMGKMLDAQSIVVAGVATGQKGGEGDILRYVFVHSVILVSLVGILVLLQAYVFPGMIP